MCGDLTVALVVGNHQDDVGSVVDWGRRAGRSQQQGCQREHERYLSMERMRLAIGWIGHDASIESNIGAPP